MRRPMGHNDGRTQKSRMQMLYEMWQETWQMHDLSLVDSNSARSSGNIRAPVWVASRPVDKFGSFWKSSRYEVGSFEDEVGLGIACT